MYNTGNAVPSAALEDMADNAQVFDALVTNNEGTTTDRKGNTRRVFQQILMDMGFQPLAGSFQTGATITARNQTLYDEVSKVFYAWGGVIPDGGYVVPYGSTPATAGGIGVGSWADKTDLMLREEIPDMPDVIAQRPSFNAIPRLLTALADYNEATDIAINVVGLGSSVGVGASLPDPTTQAPVNYLTSKLKASLDVGDIFNISSYNYSVNGSTISEYSVPLEQSVTDGHTPKLLVLAYGMNDAGVSIFNAGQTYPAIYTNAAKIIQRARALGSDVIIMTTPHHKCSAVTYYMPDAVHQVYPTYIAAPVSTESLIPPASQSNITGDFTSSGTTITVSARHLRVNQMLRKVAADYGVPVIDAEFFWFKALEKYGESALFNAGEVLHPNILGHEQSYHAAIDMFIEGLQRQSSQSIEAQMYGNIGINTKSPSAVFDVEIPYEITPQRSVAVRARTGSTDGNGVKTSGVVWHVDPTNGDLVGSGVSLTDGESVEFYRVHAGVPTGSLISPVKTTRKFYGGQFDTVCAGGFSLSGTNTIYTLPANCTGKMIVCGSQSGIGRKIYEVNFVCKSSVITLGSPDIVGDDVFSISASGANIQLVCVSAETSANWEFTISSGI